LTQRIYITIIWYKLLFLNHMSADHYRIILPQFEGPFDLLLFFIEREELNIHDISITKITRDFLDYLQHMQSLNIELASEFIYVAATLMRIKAKTILPRPSTNDEESEVDLKQNLIQKLIAYKQFKIVCEELKKLEDTRAQLYERGNIQQELKTLKKTNSTEADLSTVSLYKLMTVYQKTMFKYQYRSTEVRHTVVKYPYTMEGQKEALRQLLNINKKLYFSLLHKNSENKVQFVYNFLALLEMLQQQLISIQVGLGFNNFSIENRD